MSHFVTDGLEVAGIGRDRSGTSAAQRPYGITLFGNGRHRLESPSVGSTPGHPKACHLSLSKDVLILLAFPPTLGRGVTEYLAAAASLSLPTVKPVA